MIFIVNCDDQIKVKTYTIYTTTDGEDFEDEDKAGKHQYKINTSFVLQHWPGTESKGD